MLARRSMLVIPLLVGVGLAMWTAGIGQSTLTRVPVGPRPDRAYWQAVHVCQQVFPDRQDQLRCSTIALRASPSGSVAAYAPSVENATREGIYELIGWNPSGAGGGRWNTEAGNPVSWDSATGLWAGPELAHWWQSALALRTVIRYLERAGTTGAIYQQVLERTYALEVHHPHAIASDYFVNQYGDDTAWWGIAWVDAANYELRYAHDTTDAAKFLRVAEHDALYVARMPRLCGGVVWQRSYPPDTVTNAEYIALMSDLYSFRDAPGPFHDATRARMWLGDARSDLSWLERSGLVDMGAGKVADRLTSSCQPVDAPLTYTEGEMADALVQMGNALHDRAYYSQAEKFLNFATTRRLSNMVTPHGILQEPCEVTPSHCVPSAAAGGALGGGPVRRWFDRLAWKGILTQALDDFVTATGSPRYRAFLQRQTSAIVHNAVRDAQGLPGQCRSPSSCQFVFYWAWPLSPSRPMIVTTGTQMSALDALTGVLPHSSDGPLGVY